MSTATIIAPLSLPLIGFRTRAYFAPVNRTSGTPTLFDPAENVTWNYSKPPAPWIDLGWIRNFTRTAESTITDINAGMPAVVKMQTRQKLAATVAFDFTTWSKLTMALATSSQHMNVLAPGNSSVAIGSGAKAAAALPLQATSTANLLYLPSGTSSALVAGSMVVVDEDYTGQIGFVGNPVSAAYVQSATAVGNDPDYIRRVSFNVGRITSIGSDGGLHLAYPLPGGVPSSTMKVQQIIGLLDREGGSFFQEWSALFVVEGVQGERLCFHYPLLQSCAPAAEMTTSMTQSLQMILPSARFSAFPVIDGNDGEQVICYRTYYPSGVALI